MSLFDKLKSAASALTGSAADVSIDPDPFVRGIPFWVRSTAVIGDDDVQASGVYLKIEGREEIAIPPGQMTNDAGATNPEGIRGSGPTFQADFSVADGSILQAGQTYEWTTEITLPPEVPPRYEGRFCRHIIRVKVGIDSFGNDPDSGWVELSEKSNSNAGDADPT